jgi:hypothetical protein
MASNGAAYVAHGINAGVSRFADALEKRKEEEKQNAKKFKSLVGFAESSGMLSKDQAEVMDLDSLEGFVRGKMAKEEMDQQNARSAMAQMAQVQKMQEAEAMKSFIGDFSDFNTAYNDPLQAFYHGVSNNPGVSPQELNAFANSIPQQAKGFAPTDDYRMLQEIQQLSAAGDTEGASTLKAILDKRGAPSAGGMQMEVRPDGTVVYSQGMGPTIGFKTEAQKVEANAASTFATIDHIMANQKASDWGVRGLLGKVQDEWLAQAVPGMADPRRIDVQASVSQLRQQMMSVLKAESQISQKDKEEIMQSLPKTGAGESPQSAITKIHRAKQMMTERVRAYSQQQGKPPPIYAMTLEQIGAAKESGQISEAQAIDAILKYHSDKLPQ